MSHTTTMAERALDQRGVRYDVLEFSSEVRSAQEMAEAIGHEPHQVFKTLVARRTDVRRPMLVLVPGDLELAPKRLARSVGAKKVWMVSQRDAERLTGLQKGGISPLALLGRPFDVFLDSSANGLERLVVSAGRRGVAVKLALADLVAVTNASMVDATDPEPEKPGNWTGSDDCG